VEKIAKKVKIIPKEMTKEGYLKKNPSQRNSNSMRGISNVDGKN
jgi:hypothetical protein